MFFIISKIVYFFLAPINLIIISFILYIFISSRLKRTSNLLFLGFLFFWFILLYKPIPEFFVKSLEDKYSYKENSFTDLKGILVLGGGTGSGKIALERNDLSLSDGSERLIKAFEYIRTKPNGKVIFTGMSGQINLEGLTEAEITQRIITALGINSSNIIFEEKSQNTYQNIVFSKDIIKNTDIKNWGIVTSASHMHRAVSTFRKVCPENTFQPLPVDFKTGNSLYFYPGSMGTSLDLWDTFIHETIGFWVYKITGRL